VRRRQVTLLPQHGVERRAFEVLHDEVGPRVGEIPAVDHVDDVVVAELRRGQRLDAEAILHPAAEVLAEHLEDDGSIHPPVPREVDAPHGARAEERLRLIGGALELGADLFERLHLVGGAVPTPSIVRARRDEPKKSKIPPGASFDRPMIEGLRKKCRSFEQGAPPRTIVWVEATMSDEPEDPFLEELLDEVLAVHADLPEDIRAEMRLTLRLIATTHPIGATIVDRARPRKAPLKSGDQPKPGSAAPPAADAPLRKKEGA
jgi:hypothetical protein